MPTSPPQVRLPTSGPSFACLNSQGRASPPEPENSFAIITFGLLFLLTGSVTLPLKAVVLNVLSLTAAFGALVWVFQDGHLGAFGTKPTGTLVANMPVLLFCIAFGLSMDYEVFLVARIREYWLKLKPADSVPGCSRSHSSGTIVNAAHQTPADTIDQRARSRVRCGLPSCDRLITAIRLSSSRTPPPR